MRKLRAWLIPAAIFLACLCGLLALEKHALKSTPWPGYLHPWNSDKMMQALPVERLRADPLKSLLCLDRQPPALNVLRAGLAAMSGEPADSVHLLPRVDQLMYLAWAVQYAMLSVLVFFWLRLATSCSWFSLLGAAAWSLLPAPLHFSVLLEGTLLSALAVSWLLYELQRSLAAPARGAPLAFAAAAAFYARSVFQWYFFPVFLAAAHVGGLGRKEMKTLALLSLLLAGPLLGKQWLFKETLATSTFEGDHKLGLVWYYPPPEEVNEFFRDVQPPKLPPANSLSGIVLRWCPAMPDRFLNQVNLAIFHRYVRQQPADAFRGVMKSVALNASTFWKSSASSNADHLAFFSPLRDPGVWLFSEWRLQLLGLLTLLLWASRVSRMARTERTAELRKAAALGLVAGYVVAILHLANRYDWTEAERLKFFLEPAFFVFLLAELRLAVIRALRVFR